MIEFLGPLLTYVALGAAAWSLGLTVFNRALVLGKPLTYGILGVLALLEAGLALQAVAGVVAMVSSAGRDYDRLAYVGYLVGPLLIVPCAALWALAERSRWGPGVLLIGCLVVPVLILRLHQVWSGHA
jgi:hypothetical protein